MSKDFKQMTLEELKAYIQKNRTDDDALVELYNRKHPKQYQTQTTQEKS